MQSLAMLFDSEPDKVSQVWLPRRRHLVLRPRPRLIVAREFPASRRHQHRVAQQTYQVPALAYRAHLHPQDLDLEEYQLVPLEAVQAAPVLPTTASQQQAAVSPALPEPLSAREHELLSALAQGDTNRELAARFHISVGTVRWHLTNIYGKLGVQRRTQAIARAQALRLLPTEQAPARP